MSRWGEAAVVALVAAASLASPLPAGADAVSDGSEALRLPVNTLELPVASLDGAVESTATRVRLRTDVLFAFGRARLGGGARPSLAAAADAIAARPGRVVRVTGYADAIGSRSANLDLSRRRAEAVARALGRLLPPAAPAPVAVGRGEADPVAANTVDGHDDPRGRALNRRVEITFGP